MPLFRKYLFLLALLPALHVAAQTGRDTLNRYDERHRKQGCWVFYFDARFNTCDSAAARYYGYVNYEKGKAIPEEPHGRFGKKDSVAYEPAGDSLHKQGLILLNGKTVHYWPDREKKKMDGYEEYKNGHFVAWTQYYSSSNNNLPNLEHCYFDSLYQGQNRTFLLYKMDEGLMVYKEYRAYNKRKALARHYLVAHRSFSSRLLPIIGANIVDRPDDPNVVGRIFLELGVTKKFVRGAYIVPLDKTYKKNPVTFPSLNFSLQGSRTNAGLCVAQKFSCSYTAVLIRAEAGVINYTNLQKSDPRLLVGASLSLFGFLNETIYYTLPLSKNPFSDMTRFAFSLTIN